MIRNIILDWSGTVVDDLDAVLQATNDVFREFGRAEISRDDFRAEFTSPFARFYERFLPDVPIEKIDEIYHRQFKVRREEVNLLPGVRDFLQFCRVSNRGLYILSTMHAYHFQVQARRLDIQDYFRKSYVEVIDKDREIKRVLEENHLVPAETIFVGDMVHDIGAAKKGGVLSIGILTGFDTLEKLAAAGPAVIVKGLPELQLLLGTPRQDEDETFEIADQRVSGRIGVPDEERASPQTMAVTVRFRLFKRFIDLEDDFSRTADYSALSNEVSRIVRESESRLIESLVSQIADQLMEKFPLAYLEVELKKFVLPDTNYVSVKTVRRA